MVLYVLRPSSLVAIHFFFLNLIDWFGVFSSKLFFDILLLYHINLSPSIFFAEDMYFTCGISIDYFSVCERVSRFFLDLVLVKKQGTWFRCIYWRLLSVMKKFLTTFTTQTFTYIFTSTFTYIFSKIHKSTCFSKDTVFRFIWIMRHFFYVAYQLLTKVSLILSSISSGL